MKTVCVDLNGVLDTYTGWKGPEHEDPPREGAAEFLQVLRDRGYQVVLFSTRPWEKVRGWLVQHGLDHLVNHISAVKVPAVAYIDDRALCFRGDFAATLAELEGFKAHWEGPTEPVSRPTRGPWRVEHCDGLVVLGAPGTAGSPTYPNDKRIICEVPTLAAEGLTAEDEANAELIAAAPALREACELALPLLVAAHKDMPEHPLPEHRFLPTVIQRLRAALAQAAGPKVAAP